MTTSVGSSLDVAGNVRAKQAEAEGDCVTLGEGAVIPDALVRTRILYGTSEPDADLGEDGDIYVRYSG